MGTNLWQTCSSPCWRAAEPAGIGDHHLDEYRTHIEKDAALERPLQAVFVDNRTSRTPFSILRGLKQRGGDTRSITDITIRTARLVAAAVLRTATSATRFLPARQ